MTLEMPIGGVLNVEALLRGIIMVRVEVGGVGVEDGELSLSILYQLSPDHAEGVPPWTWCS